MFHAVTTGAYYPPVDTTWKILTTGASQLTAGALCIVLKRYQNTHSIAFEWQCTMYNVHL